MRQDMQRVKVAGALRKKGRTSKQRLWTDLSAKLRASRSHRPAVNVGEISRYSKDESRIVVGGKVLGTGDLDHKVTVAAYSFSRGAKRKILRAGGSVRSLEDLLNDAAGPKDVIVLG